MRLWRGDNKGFVSEILLLCVEVCYDLHEIMHDVCLWDSDYVVGDICRGCTYVKILKYFVCTVRSMTGSLCY